MNLYKIVSVLILIITIVANFSYLSAQEEPTQSYTTEDGVLVFSYPEGWIVESESGVTILTNDENSLWESSATQALSSEQILIIILQPHTLLSISNESTSARELLTSYIEALSDEDFDLEKLNGNITEVNLNDKSVAYSYTSDITQNQEAFFLAIEVTNEYPVMLTSITGKGGLKNFEATLLSIAASMEYNHSATNFPAPIQGEGNIVWQQQTRVDRDAANTFGYLGDIEVSVDNMIYILDGRKGCIVMNPDGEVVRTIRVPYISYPIDIEIAEDSTIWVTSAAEGRIYYLDKNGQQLFSFGKKGNETGDSGVDTPLQVELGPDDNLYVLDIAEDASGKLFARVQVFTQEGDFIRGFVIIHSGEITVYSEDPRIRISSDGLLYVLYDSIKVYDLFGNQISKHLEEEFSGFRRASDIVFDAEGNIYVATRQIGTLYKFDENGRLLQQTGKKQADYNKPFEIGEFFGMLAIAVLSNGDTIVADTNGNYAQIVRIKFDN